MDSEFCCNNLLSDIVLKIICFVCFNFASTPFLTVIFIKVNNSIVQLIDNSIVLAIVVMPNN